MNPLTQVKNTQKITAREAALGVSDAGSWHAKYKDSAYISVGNFSFELTEGDLLAVFAQYGEIVDVNLVRDKGTGKSRGFAFVAYEDQRSTVLAVDNMNGTTVLGRILKVDHVANYKKKIEEDEAEAQRKREERGVCYAFQRGECSRGSACKFSHDEKRSADTGWGSKDTGPRWGHDKHDAGSQHALGRDGYGRDGYASKRGALSRSGVKEETRAMPTSSRREDTRYTTSATQSESVDQEKPGHQRASANDEKSQRSKDRQNGRRKGGSEEANKYDAVRRKDIVDGSNTDGETQKLHMSGKRPQDWTDRKEETKEWHSGRERESPSKR